MKAATFNEKGIGLLIKEYEAAVDEDYKLLMLLFVAEYHRLIAECEIWEADLDTVRAELAQAEEIYRQTKTRDRYYIRYQYTTTFSRLLSGEYESVYDECAYLLSSATSDYDKSQILFYQGLAAYRLGRLDECARIVEEAYRYAEGIGAWLEMEEVRALGTLIGDTLPALPHSDYFETNEVIRAWIDHVFAFIDGLPRGES